MKKVAGLLCVRGGSKRLTRKNVQECDGLKLMEYPLIAMSNALCIDKIFVSTEDEEMKEIARSYGAEVIDRPWQLATDLLGDAGVKLQAHREIEKSMGADYCVYANATHPMIRAEEIDKMYDKLLSHSTAIGITTIHKMEKPAHLNNYRALLPERGTILPIFHADNVGVNVFITNNLNDLYFSNGAYGIVRLDREFIQDMVSPDEELSAKNYIEMWADLELNRILKQTAAGHVLQMGHVIPEYDAIDIHYETDVKIAETLLKLRRERNV